MSVNELSQLYNESFSSLLAILAILTLICAIAIFILFRLAETQKSEPVPVDR